MCIIRIKIYSITESCAFIAEIPDRSFRGICLFFLSNFPGATFIQGATFIPDSKVTLIESSLPRIHQKMRSVITFGLHSASIPRILEPSPQALISSLV